jgi:periplasmic divalent cation tolerance protein
MSQPAPSYGLVLTTASSLEEATSLAKSLVEARLAACVNCFPVHSHYIWQGNLENSEEWQLIIKTDLNQFATIAEHIQSRHSYTVPELIAVPIVQGSPAYLNWMAEQLL